MTGPFKASPGLLKRGGRSGRLFAVCLLALLALNGCKRRDFPQYPPNYREYAYVTNGGSNTVTVLDVVNVRLDRELPVGVNPWPWRRVRRATKCTS